MTIAILRRTGAHCLLALAAALPAAAADVMTGDLAVNDALCVGTDCVGSENFGFDTLRLKGDVLRIHFQDTSSALYGYPSTDWRLEINSNDRGGPNHFRLQVVDTGLAPLTVEGGAGMHALYVGAAGVGLGTNAPATALHVAGGDSPAIRLHQTTSLGYLPHAWDLGGNEAGFFLRDVTGGGTLPLRIRAGAPANALDVANDGDVYVGLAVTTDYIGDLVVGGAGTKLLDVVSTTNGAAQFRMITDSGNRRFVGLDSGGNVETQMIFDNDHIDFAGPTDRGANLWATIDATGIVTQGPTCNPGPCDRVFDPEYFEVPSIEDHARFMWENRYLWGVGPTRPDLPFNVTEKTAGILHELEVAHIYIEQLNTQIDALRTASAGRDAHVAALLARIEALEAAAD